MADKLYTKLAQSEHFFLIAGPCVIETLDELRRIAEFLKQETSKRNITLIFKSSWQKANRSSIDSYTGPGIEKGLKYLSVIKEEFELPLLTDIHESGEAAIVAENVDILQIPAFLSRQTSLLSAAAKTGRIINIKKGQFMAPEDMGSAAEKVIQSENKQVMLTERGTSFGYHNLVVDFRGFSVMNKMDFPVIYDVTHSLQQPSVGKVSGGNPEYAAMMAKAAIATGMVKGLFIETHPDPLKAKSDAKSMLPMEELPKLLDDCMAICKSLKY